MLTVSKETTTTGDAIPYAPKPTRSSGVPNRPAEIRRQPKPVPLPSSKIQSFFFPPKQFTSPLQHRRVPLTKTHQPPQTPNLRSLLTLFHHDGLSLYLSLFPKHENIHTYTSHSFFSAPGSIYPASFEAPGGFPPQTPGTGPL